MPAQQSISPPYGAPPPFSPPTSHRFSADLHKRSVVDIDTAVSDHERSTRAASVLSGMSVEDMEAAKTLNSLQQGLSHPKPELSEYSPQHPSQQPKVPVHVHTTTTLDSSQTEPLLRLFTSQYPLAGSLLNGSLTAYKTTQSFIPGAEWTERNVGLPIAGKVARISGVEGGLRWVLQPRRDGKPQGAPQTPDVEKGFDPISSPPAPETLPAYSAGDRSPPYTEHEVVMLDPSSSQRQQPPNWRQQLLVSTSGLGVAMSEESLRSLRFCLSWLRWANGRLGEAIQNLKALLERYGDVGDPVCSSASPMSVANLTSNAHDEQQRQAAMAARIAALRKDVLETLKKVVGIVSQYAGGALPNNARELVHRHLMSLPQRFSIANAMSSQHNGGEGSGSEAAVNANKVMVLAQEGLDMMTQVSRVVNDTLMSAEGWCEKLGRKGGEPGGPQGMMAVGGDEKGPVIEEERERARARTRSVTEGRNGYGDVKMEM